MMLVDNITFLRQRFPNVREKLKKLDGQPLEQIKIVDSKVGLPTIQVTHENKSIFLHSKYDPMKESERFIKQFEDVESYKHILFYGIGFGYHIEKFLGMYPEVSFSVYEPNEEIMYAFLENIPLKKSIVHQAMFLDVQSFETDLQFFLRNVLGTVDGNVLIVTLPSYENIFKEGCTDFYQKFKELTRRHRNEVLTDFSFEKRWVINSMLNFKYVLDTPNILHDVNKEKFKDKPAIIVSAGPSLSEEIENLRYIKENKLAYIFSVGSAINALIENDLYPDAMCTYDPKERNQYNFEKVIHLGIDNIPMIFASSVGYELLEKYKGPKMHLITTQDTVSPNYLRLKNREEEIQGVRDAPSIAVLTLQLLYALNCNPIILVGQNLAYKNNKRFAEGINTQNINPIVSHNDFKNAMEVESNNGNKVLTDEGFIGMRNQMEMYINNFPKKDIINTTKDGARIRGTIFKELAEVIESFEEPVVKDFLENNNQYNLDYVKNQNKKMKESLENFFDQFEDVRKMLKKMDLYCKQHNMKELPSIFTLFDYKFSDMLNSIFYQTFVNPMIRVEFEFLQKRVQMIRNETNVIKKAKDIVNNFGNLLYQIESIFPTILYCFNDMENFIDKKTK